MIENPLLKNQIQPTTVMLREFELNPMSPPTPATIIIRIYSDWASSTKLKTDFEVMCNVHTDTNYGMNKKYYITDTNEYTHVIILNAGIPELIPTIPKCNVVGLAQEPIRFLRYVFGKYQNFVEYAKTNIGVYYIGDSVEQIDHEPFKEGCNYILYNSPIALPIIKTKIMSIMISNRNYNVSHPYYAPGHVYRHKLVKAILKTDLDIDIYGRGCQYYEYIYNDARIKGTFAKNEPYEDYQFHICIENYQSHHYFSEKIINPLLCEATPVYLGCVNIENYFPKNIITLTGNENLDMDILEGICKNPGLYRKYINQTEIEKIVNPLKNLNKIFT